MGISLVDVHSIGTGVHFVDPYKNTPNTAIFGQGLITHGEWRYATYYGDDRGVRLARQNPQGAWETITLPMSLSRTDSHNTLALGASPADGRLHICAGHHNGLMQYTFSSPNFLNNTPTLSDSLFSTPTSTLNGVVIGNMTYPTFTTKPNGELLFWWRNGGSGNGRLRLAEWSNGVWTILGDVTSSTGTYTASNGGQSNSRNFYWTIPMYDSDGTLHMCGTWREFNPAVLTVNYNGVIANHHTSYVRSSDDGRTWFNNVGTQVATTDSDPLSWTDQSALVDTGTDTRFALQVPTMALGPGGLVGYLPDYVRGSEVGSDGAVTSEAERVALTAQHPRWRNPTNGVWNAVTVGVPTGAANTIRCQYPTGIAGRGHMVFGSTGTMYVIFTGFRIYAASPPNYMTWSLVRDDSKRLNPHCEAQIDRSQEADGIISFLYAEASTGTTTAICVRDYILS